MIFYIRQWHFATIWRTAAAVAFLIFQQSGFGQIATSYPNDTGIELDSNVLFTEMFDDGKVNILSRYSNVLNAAGMTVDADVPPGSVGPGSLKITNKGGTNNGGHLFKRFAPGWDSVVYIRYYVKYPLVSNGYIHHESVWFGGYNPATSYPNPQAGTCGLGDSRLAIAYEPLNEPKMNTYLYWGEMNSWNGGLSCYGNDMIHGTSIPPSLVWDEWMCVEIMIKLNNPVSESNGELRVWQNGTEVGYWGPGFPNGHWLVDSWYSNPNDPPFPGFRWRTDPNLKINYIWIEFYDDTSPANVVHHIKYDHLVMAKKYIGPIHIATEAGDKRNQQEVPLVYPNPSEGLVTVDLKSGTNGRFELFNAVGETVYSTEVTQRKTQLRLPVSPGLYGYKIHSPAGFLKSGTIFIGK